MTAPRIVILGDAMLDAYWHGESHRVSPEAPVPIVNWRETEYRAGGAANVALNLAHLGADVRIIGVIGADEAGETLKELLADAGVEARFIVDAAPTIAKTRVVANGQQVVRLDREHVPHTDAHTAADNAKQRTARLAAEFAEALAWANEVHAGAAILSDYGKGALSDAIDVGALIKAAQNAGVPVSLDPKGLSFDKYAGASVLTPNAAEFAAIAGAWANDAELAEKMAVWAVRLKLDALLVTRGASGMTLWTRGVNPWQARHQDKRQDGWQDTPQDSQQGTLHHMPAKAKAVFDVSGAGDTVIAAFTLALASGLDYETAMHWANTAAGIVVGKSGTATVARAELAAALDATPTEHKAEYKTEHKSKILSVADATALARQCRVVFTNGCFDILHYGHITYLKAARDLGDALIVAVNSDASVRRLKGATRPINLLSARLAVLAALECVDGVIVFGDEAENNEHDDTPLAVLRAIRPHVLVKGGDYTPHEVVGFDLLQSYGGEVICLPFVSGYSSTALWQKQSTKPSSS